MGPVLNIASSRHISAGGLPHRRFRHTGEYLAGLGVLLAFASVSLLALAMPDKTELALVIGVGLIAGLCIIRWPVTGTYLTAGIAILFDTQSSPVVHTLISDAGIFRNILYVNAPEIILALALASALFRRFHGHKGLNKGPMFWPMLVFGVLVVVGEVIGMLGGGDFKTSLWEIRPLLYLVVFYILAVNTITEPHHVRSLLRVTILCIFLRCIEGIFRYIIMPAEVRSIAEVVLEHDDSLFMAVGLALLPVVAYWRAWLSRWMLYALAVMSPLIMYVIVINHRRAAYLCLILILMASLPLVWLSLRSAAQRRILLSIMTVAAITGSVYLAIFWNSTNGIIAEPAQAIRSVINPDERDYESNLYRDIETENLQFTISTSPLVGIGFGRPMIVIRPMVDLRSSWALQLYMPHNNLLWIWMRTGILGFMSFWVIVGLAIMLTTASMRMGAEWMKALLAINLNKTNGATGRNQQHTLQIQRQECAELLVLIFTSQAVLASLLSLAQVDQGLMSFRLMMYSGIALGTLAAAWNIYDLQFRLPQSVSEGQVPQHDAGDSTRRRVRLLVRTN